MSGIYIHIPFCKQACSYCDFYFMTRQSLREAFVGRLCEEIDRYGETSRSQETVETIYLGGGTPSLLTAREIERILKRLDKNFPLRLDEVTMELNPDDVSQQYLADLHSLGITRASMGVQSFDPARLKFMHRAHTPEEAAGALGMLRTAGFGVFNVDLIYGNPGQTTRELEKDIDRFLEYDPPHISAYALTVEPATRLGKQIELGRLEPAEEELVNEQFVRVGQMLAERGIYRYEISNYSKPGFEAVHNSRYWRHGNYLGLGPSSHSFWWEEEQILRWKTVNDIRKYLARPFEENYVEREVLTREVLAGERLMLGLRTSRGVATDELEQKYSYRLTAGQVGWLDQKKTDGYLQLDGDTIVLTEEGLKIADYLTVELLHRGQEPAVPGEL